VKSKSVLIVGSKGFIGSHLTNYCVKLGYQVWGADVVVDYAESSRYFVIDAVDADFRSAFEEQDYDVCINCSGAASVPDSLVHPMRDYNLNVNNVFRLLNTIRLCQPGCKFLNLSSAAVYGNPKSFPIREDAPTKPLSPYGVHKLMSENICLEYFQYFGIKTCSLRIFSAYGEGLKKQLFWDLYQKARFNREVQLFGSGRESRDFIYIGDLNQAIVKVVENADFIGQSINVGNGEEITISTCAKAFYKLFDHSIEYRFSGESREGDPTNWVADVSVLFSLGYRQEVTLEMGLRNYYIWALKVD